MHMQMKARLFADIFCTLVSVYAYGNEAIGYAQIFSTFMYQNMTYIHAIKHFIIRDDAQTLLITSDDHTSTLF